nr:hypothetical protein [Tanacetum cinerariifolium]
MIFDGVFQVSNLPLRSLSGYRKGHPKISPHMANSLVVIALHSAWPSVAQLTLVVERFEDDDLLLVLIGYGCAHCCFANFFEESFGDTIEIHVDVKHPVPVTSTVFPHIDRYNEARPTQGGDMGYTIAFARGAHTRGVKGSKR